MSKKTLNFNDVETNKKEFLVSKQPIALDSVLINKIAVSDHLNIMTKVLNILKAIKTVMSLDCHVLFYLRWVDTENILTKGEKVCLL